MTPEQWQKARALFEAALAHSPAERDPFLIAASGEQTELLAAARNLLQAHEQAGNFLERPATEVPNPSLTFTTNHIRKPSFHQCFCGCAA